MDWRRDSMGFGIRREDLRMGGKFSIYRLINAEGRKDYHHHYYYCYYCHSHGAQHYHAIITDFS